jgi:hypothetical protein
MAGCSSTWLGDVYGQALLDLLHPLLAVSASAQPGLACCCARSRARCRRSAPNK